VKSLDGLVGPELREQVLDNLVGASGLFRQFADHIAPNAFDEPYDETTLRRFLDWAEQNLRDRFGFDAE
jgi:hypothetical protein